MIIRKPRRRSTSVPRRGLTLVELSFSAAISAMVSIALIVLMLFGMRVYKSVFYQQATLGEARRAVEKLNFEIRHATTPLYVYDDAGQGAQRGNRLVFTNPDRAQPSAFEVTASDGDLSTPEGNSLMFYADADSDSGQQVARWACPMDPDGCFVYRGARAPLEVRLRVGDPVDDEQVSFSGLGRQGTEINVAIGPRNQ